jgi:transcription-repair coupling factor (superfamily II helicase)
MNHSTTSIDQLLNLLPQRKDTVVVSGLGGAERALMVARAFRKLGKSLFIILPSPKEAEQFLDDFYFFTRHQAIPCHYFPPYNLMPYKFFAYHNETAAKRIATLYRIRSESAPHVVVTTPEALLQKIIPWEELNDFAELAMAGEALHREALIGKMVSGGYSRTPLVEEPGDFSVRGGILDLFSPLYPEPLRIEFFGDTVDSIRFFSAASQRTLKPVDEAIILPAREVVFNKERFNQIASRIRTLGADQELPHTAIREVLRQIGESQIPHGAENLLPLLYDDPDTLFSYAPSDALFILVEPGAVGTAAEEYHAQAQVNFGTACAAGKVCAPPEALLVTWTDAEKRIAATRPLHIQLLPPMGETPTAAGGDARFSFTVKDNSEISLKLKAHRDKEHLLLPLKEWIEGQHDTGLTPVLVSAGRTHGQRLTELLSPYGIEAVPSDGFPAPQALEKISSHPSRAAVCTGRITDGFVWPEAGLALITEKEIFGAAFRKRPKATTPGIQTQLIAIEDLTQDDLVVHQEHGIGQYQGLVKLKLGWATNDFLLITYKEGDKLYLPVDRMGLIQKYMGVDGIAPVLDKLGGKSWARVKDRVKRSAEKIAGELLKLYAARQVEKGMEFFVPERAFQEFEAAFPYEETVDQAKAIEDVISDMERSRPMDRLVCGDVGYGKTEVALRAAFVAVNNGKQVAILVPTTVLAEQHFATFRQRFERQPIIVESLNRFRSAAQQRETIERLKEGKIDVLVGTHRLLSRDVAFKELGLLVLDEEQRFGVKHKEKLKKLRRNVDVLALTATPIPRTLHLSLMGIRDISLISTPPEQRHPIVTYVTEYDDTTAKEAILKELKRKGQIFFVHNHVASIDRMAAKLKKLVPEVRLAVAHGQMKEDQLEKVMVSFMDREIDMLVCTTIIESGIDISAANTILINRADRFGLAQIYQLRGRVGRSDEQAYAYLFIPADSVMTTDAQKRLKVLMEHSDLGSGFQIAMSDLKIRGGGTILGASQSGHIAAVGYDMFLKLMENSVAQLKGEATVEPLDPEINIPISAFLPETYMPDIDQRLTAYRRLAKLTDPKDISRFKAEMIDRFGALPPETVNLLMKIMLRIMAVRAGVSRLDVSERQLTLYFSPEHQENPMALVDMATSQPNKMSFTAGEALKVVLSAATPNAMLAQTKNILKEIAGHVNP